MNMKPVTVIVPVYGGLEYTERCLESVVRHAGGHVLALRHLVLLGHGQDRRAGAVDQLEDEGLLHGNVDLQRMIRLEHGRADERAVGVDGLRAHHAGDRVRSGGSEILVDPQPDRRVEGLDVPAPPQVRAEQRSARL